jgi:hypothetical protein
MLTSMNNLAWIWKSQGRDDEALNLMTTCVQLLTGKLGVNHPNTRVCNEILINLVHEQLLFSLYICNRLLLLLFSENLRRDSA